MSSLALLLVLAAAVAHATWNLATKRTAHAGVPFLWLGALASVLLWLPLAAVRLVGGGVDWLALGGGAGMSARPARRDGSRPVVLRDGPNRVRAGVLYGLVIGVAIATYTLWDAYVVTVLGVDPVAFMVGCALGEVVLLLPVVLRARARVAEVWRASRRSVLAVGVLSPLSYILVLVAFTIAPVSLVAPARELSVVLVALAGWLLLREPHPVQRVAGSVVVLVGVALLAGA